MPPTIEKRVCLPERLHNAGEVPAVLAQQVDQLIFHELIVVRNIQHVQRLVGDFLTEIGAQALGVLVLHDEDHVGPADVGQGDPVPGIVRGAS